MHLLGEIVDQRLAVIAGNAMIRYVPLESVQPIGKFCQKGC